MEDLLVNIHFQVALERQVSYRKRLCMAVFVDGKEAGRTEWRLNFSGSKGKWEDVLCFSTPVCIPRKSRTITLEMKSADPMGGWESGGDLVPDVKLTDLLWCVTNTYPFSHTNVFARSVTATAFVLYPQSGHLTLSVKAVFDDVSSKETVCVRVTRKIGFGIYCPVHESEATPCSELEKGMRVWVWDFTLPLTLLGGSLYATLKIEFFRNDGSRLIGYCYNQCGAWNRDLKIKSLDGRTVGKCMAGDHVVADGNGTQRFQHTHSDADLHPAAVAGSGGLSLGPSNPLMGTISMPEVPRRPRSRTASPNIRSPIGFQKSPCFHQSPLSNTSAHSSGQLQHRGSGTGIPTAIREVEGSEGFEDNIYEEVTENPRLLPPPRIPRLNHFPTIPPVLNHFPTIPPRRSTAPALSAYMCLKESQQPGQNAAPVESDYEEVVLSDAVRIFKEMVPTYVSNPTGATMPQSSLLEVLKNIHNNQTLFPSPISLEEARLLLCVIGYEDRDGVGCTDFNRIYNTATAIGASFMAHCKQGQVNVGVDAFWKCVDEVNKGNYSETRKQECVRRFCRYADRVSYDEFIRIMADLRSDLAS